MFWTLLGHLNLKKVRLVHQHRLFLIHGCGASPVIADALHDDHSLLNIVDTLIYIHIGLVKLIVVVIAVTIVIHIIHLRFQLIIHAIVLTLQAHESLKVPMAADHNMVVYRFMQG